MRVLYFSEASNMAGANQSLLGMIKCLKLVGIEPFVVFPCDGVALEVFAEQGIPCKIIKSYLWVERKKTASKTILRRVRNKLIEFFAELQIHRLVRKKAFDILHINSLLTSGGARTAISQGVPLVWHIREFIEEDHGYRFYNQKRSIRIISKADCIIAISNCIYEKYRVLLKCRSIKTIYNGVVYENRVNEHRLLRNDTVSIVMAGRITFSKGQMEALQAMILLRTRDVHNVRLRFWGYCHEEEYMHLLEKIVLDNGLEHCVEFCGFSLDIHQIWNEADIALVCSKAEAFGRVTVEAMMAGVLVIGANTAGTLELINDGETGLLYEQGSPDSLADKLMYAMEHKAEMRAIMQKGKEYMQKNMTAEQNARNVYQVYKEVLAKKAEKNDTFIS